MAITIRSCAQPSNSHRDRDRREGQSEKRKVFLLRLQFLLSTVRGAEVLQVVHAVDFVHLCGIAGVRVLSVDRHVDFVHLRICRRDTIPVHPGNGANGRRCYLILGRFRRRRDSASRVLFRGRTSFARETRRTAVRDTDELPRLVRVPSRASTLLLHDAVEDEVPATLELDDIAAIELAHVRVRERVLAELCHWRDEILHVVVFFELLFGDDVVVVDQCRVDKRVRGRWLCQPCDLLGFPEVSIEIEHHGQSRDRA
jgi:hypothetical protein